MPAWFRRVGDEEKRKKERFEQRRQSAIGRAVVVACAVVERESPGTFCLYRMPVKRLSELDYMDGQEGAYVVDEDCNFVHVCFDFGGVRVIVHLSRLQIYKDIDKWEVTAQMIRPSHKYRRGSRIIGIWRSVGFRGRLVKEDHLLSV